GGQAWVPGHARPRAMKQRTENRALPLPPRSSRSVPSKWREKDRPPRRGRRFDWGTAHPRSAASGAQGGEMPEGWKPARSLARGELPKGWVRNDWLQSGWAAAAHPGAAFPNPSL